MTNLPVITELSALPFNKRLLGIDPGTKRIGIAISDETQTVVRPLTRMERTSWKKLLQQVKDTIKEFDACAVVIGLPLDSEGNETDMTAEAIDMARKFELSLDIPVIMRDERNSSYEAKARLWETGASLNETRDLVDSEAAVIILEDLLAELNLLRKTNS